LGDGGQMSAVPMPANIDQPLIGNVEAEACLLGALMQTNILIDSIADKLKPEDFAEALHGDIFSAIVKEHSLGRSATPVSLRPYFENHQTIKEVGGLGYLGQLTGQMVVGAHDLCAQVSELACRRRLVERLKEILETTADYEVSNDEIVAEVEGALSDATKDSEGQSELTAGKCVADAIAAIERHDPGVTCDIEAINHALGPIRKQNLAILAGRPGMGKTAVALGMARGAAQKGHGVLFVSLEMSAEELGERLACDLCFVEETLSGVPYDAMVSSRVDREQMRWLSQAKDQADKLPLQVVDISALKIGRLATMVRRWKRRFAARGQSLDLVVVDYLQLLSPDYRVSGPYEAITLISKGLKSIAKANDLGILALAQLSREVEKRHDKRPQLSDLRDSGQIEQDADAVLFLLRDEYYLLKAEPEHTSPDRAQWEAELSEVKGVIQFMCAKRRKGPERTTKGRFYGAFQAVRG
jgi:replicative DNA helicase